MDEREWLTEKFEENRSHLRAVAYRMLGSLTESDDALQEAWLRIDRANTSDIENLDGWLTTVVARICLDMLRTRKARREESLGEYIPDPVVSRRGANPEDEALLAESVGLALLVVLDTLSPAERLAFVLHDMFVVPFDEIAPIVDRSPTAARQLASRARRRVQRGSTASKVSDADLTGQRAVVDAFLAAVRSADFEGLLAVLAPDVVIRDSRVILPTGGMREIRGMAVVAEQAMKGGARLARVALVNGSVGVIVAPRGRLLIALDFTITDEKISAIDVIAGNERLRQLELAVLDY